MPVRPLLTVTLILTCCADGAFSQPRETRLVEELQTLLADHEGDVALSVRHLDSTFEFHHRADTAMPTASLIKLAVMIEAYRQADANQIDLNALVTLKDADKVPGSGILTEHFSDGSQLKLVDCIRLMIAFSDNTATNLVLDQIGISSTGETMERLGFPATRIHSKVYRGNTSVDPERSREFGLGSTTTREMTRLLDRLNSGTLVSSAACKKMMAHLEACESRDLLPRFLPGSVTVAHKSGAVSAVRCDAGLLTTDGGIVAICVLTAKNKDRSWGDQNSAEILCGRIGESVYRHFSPHGPSGAPKAELQIGDFGKQVETLQRTLNARLRPSPSLSVDGDFGPATQAGVRRFQSAQGLPVNGIADAAVWKLLSPLLTTAAEVPPPEIANSEPLPTQPADEVDGPPTVSCDAWAIVDGHSGEILWAHDAAKPLATASTTKIMTACLVLQLAQKHPEILDETTAFSLRADKTRGSTSGIMEGESLSIRELLFGLLLPSGNDASVALAEHFGHRFAADAESEGLDALDAFVAQMNRTAGELGMSETVYRNPHGLDTPGHVSSAGDLCILARTALSLPLFRDYVSTRQRGCTVTGPGGYSRNILWKNTNRLLAIDGYHGVKTGTTTRAGACLVSTGDYMDRQLIVAVLGSSSSEGRYVDTRNLFRFAWRMFKRDAKGHAAPQ